MKVYKFGGASIKDAEGIRNISQFVLNENVEPLIYMSDEVNVLRKDDTIENISQEDALKNAPKKDSDYILVPKVIDK